MGGHELLVVIDGQLVRKRQSDLDRLTRAVSRDAIPAATDLDVGISPRLPNFAVGRIVACGGQGL